MRRLVPVVCVEFCLIVLLALQVAGAKGGGAGPGAGALAGERQAAAAASGSSSLARPGEPEDRQRRAAEGPAGSAARAPDAPVRQRVAHEAVYDPGDAAGIVLSGVLRGSDGSTVADASLWLGQDDGGVSANVAKAGSYAAAGLRPGSWRLTARADGFANRDLTHVLTDAAFQSLDVELTPAYRVRVRVETPDGKDANALVSQQLGLHWGLHIVGSDVPIPQDLAPTEHGIVWHGNANWRRDDRPKDGVAGTLELPAPPPAYVAALLRHVVLAQERVEPGQKEVRLVVDPALAKAKMSAVRLRLLDADSGAPIADASCTARSSSGGGARGKTDAEGRALLENALPGLLILEIEPKGNYERVTTMVRADSGETAELGDLRLTKQVTCSGVVLGEDGKPAGGAGVQWTELRWRSGPQPFVDHRSSSVDGEGKFSLWGVGSGKMAITARASDGKLAIGVFDNPSATPIELRLAAPATAIVTRPPDAGRSFVVTFYDRTHQPVGAWRLASNVQRMPVRLPAGEYAYEAHDERDRLVASGKVVLGPVVPTIELK